MNACLEEFWLCASFSLAFPDPFKLFALRDQILFSREQFSVRFRETMKLWIHHIISFCNLFGPFIIETRKHNLRISVMNILIIAFLLYAYLCSATVCFCNLAGFLRCNPIMFMSKRESQILQVQMAKDNCWTLSFVCFHLKILFVFSTTQKRRTNFILNSCPVLPH